MIQKCVIVLLLLVVGLAPAQEVKPVDALFYQAYYYDRGDRDLERALALYQRFLDASPEHRHASEAARNALNLMKQAGRESAAFEERWKAQLSLSAKPGINSQFLDPKLDVTRIQNRFEGESREIFRHREELTDLIGLTEGKAIADIGAGTGIFTWAFARKVGEKGRVFAVEIAPRFIDHLKRVATNGGLSQVQVVHCTERSAQLPEASIDFAFICDTYHHFEFPLDTMRSIHRALKPGGQVILIDFHRIPGQSRQWLLDHVRAGQEVFRREIESAGFGFVREEQAPLIENYYLRFEKR